MPYNPKKKTAYMRIKDKKARQQYKKYNQINVSRQLYSRNGSGVSDSQLMKMKAVCSSIAFTGTGASPEVIKFRLNGCHAYSSVVSPSQPLYWDEMVALYGQYICYGCKVRSQFIYTGDATSSTLVGMAGLKSEWSGPSEKLILENRATKKALISTQRPTVTMTEYYPINKLVGISKDKLAINASYTALTTTNPPYLAFVNNFAIKQSGSNASAKLICELVFYVKFSDRKNIGLST